MDEVERFFQLVWGEKDPDNGLIEVVSGVYKQGRLFDLLARHYLGIEAAIGEVRRALACSPPREIYCCVSLGGEHPEAKHRLNENQVSATCGLWADIDWIGPEHTARRYPPDEEHAWKVLNAMGVKPTMVLHTGGGLQAWWLLKEPLVYEAIEERIRMRAMAHDWIGTIQQHAAAMGNWELDSAIDLVRILRVAGTNNNKGEVVVPVRIVYDDGPRYGDVSEFEAFIPTEIRKHTPISNQEIAGLAAEIEGIIGNGRNEGFPPDKLEALKSNDPKFEATWKRKRPDLGSDASRYDASLAWYAVRIGCSTQEIVQLITDARRLSKDDPKLKRFRVDYLARTILWAKKNVAENELFERLDRQEIELISHEKRQDVLRQIQEATGIRDLAGIIKYGRDDSVYWLVLKDGHRFVVGRAEEMLSRKKFEKPVYNSCRVVLPSLKDREWTRVAAQMQAIAEEEASEDEPRRAELETWIEQYLDSVTVYQDETYTQAFEGCEPFVKDGRLHVMVSSLRRYIVLSLMEKVETKELRMLLKECGFRGDRHSAWVRSAGKHLGRYYYSRRLIQKTCI